MNFAGLEKCSFVDYPGRIAAVVFAPGCNFNCFYCHNRQLISAAPDEAQTEESVLALLRERRSFLDAVVVSGGEPTLQPGLPRFVQRVRDLGYLVKLDTNGSNPNLLRSLISTGLLDYVAMDIKAPLEKYETIAGKGINLLAVAKSISVLLDGDIDYEFRTTVTPQLMEADIRAIAERIVGARRYVLQQYRIPAWAEESGDSRFAAAPHPPAEIRRMARVAGDLVARCETRGAGGVSEAA